MSDARPYPVDYPNWFRHPITARPVVRRWALRAKILLKGGIDRYLARVRTLVHLGAHHGEERFLYDAHGLDVTWIEANPAVHARLAANLAGLPRQRALAALVTDRDGTRYRFHLANGAGSASSIFARARHRELFPTIAYEGEIELAGTTLPTLLDAHGVTLAPPAALVMDIQGAELLALRGALPLLGRFRYIKTEASDIETYAGGCRQEELDGFLRQHGFVRIARQALTQLPDGSGLSDLLYRRA